MRGRPCHAHQDPAPRARRCSSPRWPARRRVRRRRRRARPAARSRCATASGTRNQQPVYQKCADAFQQQNPNIRIQIELKNWGDYWGGLARGFIAETAPDVFTDHLAKYPQFATSEVIEPLDRHRARRSTWTSTCPGLARPVEVAGRQAVRLSQGLGHGRRRRPTRRCCKDAGITSEQLDTATWNPEDGGTFEEIAAQPERRQERQARRRAGLRPGQREDLRARAGRRRVHLRPDDLGAASPAASASSCSNKNPWGTKYHYDDPRFIQTIALVAAHDREGLHAARSRDGPHARRRRRRSRRRTRP